MRKGTSAFDPVERVPRRVLRVVSFSLLPTMASAAEIAQILVSTLSSDPNVRIAAELRLSEQFTNPRMRPLSSVTSSLP